jgi:hypothetical protein
MRGIEAVPLETGFCDPAARKLGTTRKPGAREAARNFTITLPPAS